MAVISIQGIITKADSAWNRICGMTSSALAQQDLKAALQDSQAHSILLWIDSPGGMVDGAQDLAQAVFAARGQKPLVSLADGCMCSAAYWVGAAAEKVYITSDTTEVGSIGVVAAHTDVSAQEAQMGIKTTEITAGAYKRIASQHGPLSEPGRATIQAQVDHIYQVFVDSISTSRGVSVDTVLADMADGRVFLGQQAVTAGLVDGVSTMADMIAQLNEDRMTRRPGVGAASIPPKPPSQENAMSITREQLAAEAPELLTAILAEGEAKGAAAETARVKGCLDTAQPGYEAQALALALDGKTTPGEASLAIGATMKADLAKAYASATSATTGAAVVTATDDPAHLEAEAQREKVEAEPEKNTGAASGPKQATEHAAAIRTYIAAEEAKGRRVSAGQASQELARQGKG